MSKLAAFLKKENEYRFEYGLIAASISVVIIAVVNVWGTQLHAAFANVLSPFN